MEREIFDTIVIGAGPAGATAAWSLARSGASVLLLDRAPFPRYKVCGCCLNSATLDMFNQMGLSNRLHGAAISNFRCFAGSRCVTLKLPDGLAVSRDALDMMLVEHAMAAGVEFIADASASPGNVAPDHREVVFRGRTVRARLVIAADGLCGSFTKQIANLPSRISTRSHIGVGTVVPAPTSFSPGTIYMAAAPGGYVGSVRLADGQLNIAAALDPQFIRQHESVGHAVAAILHDAGCPSSDSLLAAQWHGTGLLTRRCTQLGDHRLLVLGDAAGYVEPFTGEGIAWAMASAFALAPIAQNAIHRWDERYIHQWTAAHRRLICRRQLTCRLVAALLRRPRCVSAALAMLCMIPAAAAPLVRTINSPLHPQSPAITT